MYQTGDYIVYGTRGVCQIKNIGTLDIPGAAKEKLYYTLSPCSSAASTVYTPVEQETMTLRPVMNRDEALTLIDSIPEIGELIVRNEKMREQVYRDAIKTGDNRELIRVIRTVYSRGRSRLAEGKKATVSDEKYSRIAGENLYGELAISLSMDRNEVERIVSSRIEAAYQEVVV